MLKPLLAFATLLQAVAAARHHHAPQPHCLDRTWRHKMLKHAELVQGRTTKLATSIGQFQSERTAYDAFEPTYTCHSEWRVGKLFGDGGKFVCGEPEFFRAKECVAYSVGSSGDSTFEADVVKRFGCKVHTFDPTGNTTYYDEVATKAGATFHAWGVGKTGTTLHNSDTKTDNELVSLADIMARLGHKHIDILKIDCEGCEFGAFAELWPRIEDGSVSVGQIQVELHGFEFARLKTFFDGAEAAGYMIFHKERNQWGCDGYNCVEYALIHISEAHRIFEATHCNELES